MVSKSNMGKVFKSLKSGPRPVGKSHNLALVQRTAMHEAGHVIVGLATGFEIVYSILNVNSHTVDGYASGVAVRVG